MGSKNSSEVDFAAMSKAGYNFRLIFTQQDTAVIHSMKNYTTASSDRTKAKHIAPSSANGKDDYFDPTSRSKLKEDIMGKIRTNMSIGAPSCNPGILKMISLTASFENAARLGQLCLVEAMIVDGIDVNEADISGRTTLHWGAERGRIEVAKLLLKCGTNVALCDRKRKTPADYAQAGGYWTLYELLAIEP